MWPFSSPPPPLPPHFSDPETQRWLWEYFWRDAPGDPPPLPHWLIRFRPPPVWLPWLAAILWLIAIYAWVWALIDLFTDPKQGADPGPVCGSTGEDMITRVADVTVFGARRSHNAAVAEAQTFCPTLAASCTGTCANGNPCTPKPHLIDENQFTVASWWSVLATRTVLEYNCQCSCA